MLKSRVIKSFVSLRGGAFDAMREQGVELQHRTLKGLLRDGQHTIFGKEHALRETMSAEEFARKVPVFDYDAYKPYIERMLAGERNVASRGRVEWFARSSGTTSDRSKYIPITRKGMWHNHLLGMRDVASMYAVMHPSTNIFRGKTLTLGGACSRENGVLMGDLSAVIINRLPIVTGWFRLPRMKTAMIENFDERVEAICRECTKERVTAFAGVPSWNLLLMRRVLEYTGKSNLLEVWEDLEMFAHGGVGFAPYRAAFKELIPDDRFNYMETYNASEGFFAMADDTSRDDMMLMTDYGIYYEFRRGDEIVPLEGVRCGERYALIITTPNALWRYEIGDVVEFTSVAPYRIRIVGRTHQYINAFGEEVMSGNVEQALFEACLATGTVVEEYTVAPKYMTLNERGAHEWAIEFATPPADVERFVALLDDALRRANSDYDAKRRTTLSQPIVHVVPRSTFVSWVLSRGKNKVPHLRNDRQVIEEILSSIENK